MNLIKFENVSFGEMEILVENGKEYFPATEVAKILGYTNPQKAIRDHCKEKGCTIRSVGVITGKKSDGTDAIQFVNKKFIDEGNLYRLIAKSNLPQAEIFETWVFDEVLPTIRKTGNYISQNYINNNFIELEKEKIKIEKSKILKELSQSISNEKYKETLTIYSANALYDTPILQLPAIERKSYSAGELSQIIMNDYGIKISSKRIGMIANKNNLKTKENGYYAYDKSKHSNKQVESFRYYENVINEIMKYIN